MMGEQVSRHVPFIAKIVQETSADIADFNENKGPTDTFTQYLSTTPTWVFNGSIKHVMFLVDNANARTMRFILSEGPEAGNQASQAKFVFDSNEEMGADIADNTLETFRVDQPFRLDEQGRIYHTVYAAAGALGNCLGRLVVWGIAYL